MNKLYLLIFTSLVFCNVLPLVVSGQCGSFVASTTAYESRCTATGSIKVNATGGSGNYKYKVTGTLNTNFTSTDSITGLAPGTYTVTVTDITSNCTITVPNVIVPGAYHDPRFTLNTTDVSCDNGSNGTINLATQNFGRAPFTYSIIAPSPMGIGTTNSTGTFNNLSAGVFTIRLTDSCGGIQTRLVTINNYTWKIDSVRFRKISCDSATGYIHVSDNRGNISTITGLPGFMYAVVRAAGDTIWSTNPSFTFYLGGQNNFEAIVKDPCGKIKKFPVAVSFKPSVGASVNMYAFTCRQFSVSVAAVTNFFNPVYCLTDNNGIVIECNATGIFTNINYGSYCIAAHDSCTDTTITRCFTSLPQPASVNNSVLISQKICSGFTATITGQSGLTNPEYCIYDSLNNLIGCNSTGVFNNLTYGDYCININDTCRDTTMQRCFTVKKPVPVVDSIHTGYLTCNNFGITVTGDSLTNPRFCLYDSSGILIDCNYTGVFDSLVYGSYCVSVYDSCYDTTITRCTTIGGPTVIYDLTSEITNRACSTFTATIFSSSLIAPAYCLYRVDSILVDCNSTGIFDSLPYGTYFIHARNACPDTTFNYYISAYPPLPSLGAAANITNRTCATFSVNIGGQQNLTNPQYCIYNSNDSLLLCNSTGSFLNLVYGSYCIKMKDGCYDTTITRCFSAQPLPVDMRVATSKSCNYGNAILNISITGGVQPFTIRVMNPDGSHFSSGVYNSNTINIDNIPAITDDESYTVFVTDNCGNTDAVLTTVITSLVTHVATAIPKCPSSTWVNGSGSIETTAASNTGSITIRIIKKNNVTIPSISPSNVLGGLSTFNNLGPGTYIIRYKINDACKKNLYDTVTIPVYQYPTLDKSSAYQCDHGGFSLGAVVSNGVGPFLYEIIGSAPSTPSIIAPPQANPVFNINNGASYSLVRLRAIDACGNASLEDASILPLANNGIISDFNCFQIATTLRVDTLYNSNYSWYKKHAVDDADSIYMGDTYSLNFPYVTPADTGLYVCHINVNSGCIKRTYYYRLDGTCYRYLPITLQQFGGVYAGNNILLNWQVAANADFKNFIVERRNGNSFKQLGRINVKVDPLPGATYLFKDSMPDPFVNYYRLKMTRYNNTIEYSNIILICRKKEQSIINVYPNPAYDFITIEIMQNQKHRYTIKFLNMVNQVVKEVGFDGVNGNSIKICRPKEISAGIYIIKLLDLTDNTEFARKVIIR